MVAYRDPISEIRAICHGQKGIIYSLVHSSSSASEISVLNCSEKRFRLENKIPLVIGIKANSICYIPSSKQLSLAQYLTVNLVECQT